jgi:hypothetical protein
MSAASSSTPPSDSHLVFPDQREKPEYWDAYPKDTDAFAARVHEGIVYSYLLRLPSKREPKESYQGIHRSAVGQDLIFWLADPKDFARRHDTIVIRAIEEFIHDRQDAMVEWRQGIESAHRAFAEASRLPTPPLGFQWVSQQRKWVIRSVYRLEAEGSESADPRPHTE